MGQKYNAEYKADVLKLADEIGVGAACQQSAARKRAHLPQMFPTVSCPPA